MAIAILTKKVLDTNVIGALHIYIIPMQIIMYVFIAYQKINHFILGMYVKQQIIKTNFLCGFTKNL